MAEAVRKFLKENIDIDTFEVYDLAPVSGRLTATP